MTLTHVLHVTAELHADVAAFLVPAWRELAACGVRQTLLHAGGADTLPPGLARSAGARGRIVALELPPRAGLLDFARVLRAALHVELASHACQALHLHGPRAGLAGRLVLPTLGAQRPPVFHSPHGLSGLAREHPVADLLVALGERAPGLSELLSVTACPAEARRLQHLSGREPVLLVPPVEERLLEQPRAADEPARVIAIGHASSAQGPDRFAELAARFHFADEPTRFAWIGTGDAHHEQLLRAAGVELIDDGDAETIATALARAAVVVLPGRGHGAPLLLAQAMAAQAPIVASDLPGHRALLRHGETGLLAADLAELALQLKGLLDDPAQAAALGRAARDEARARFAPELFRQSLLDLYRLHERVAPQQLPAEAAPAPAVDVAAP